MLYIPNNGCRIWARQQRSMNGAAVFLEARRAVLLSAAQQVSVLCHLGSHCVQTLTHPGLGFGLTCCILVSKPLSMWFSFFVFKGGGFLFLLLWDTALPNRGKYSSDQFSICGPQRDLAVVSSVNRSHSQTLFFFFSLSDCHMSSLFPLILYTKSTMKCFFLDLFCSEYAPQMNWPCLAFSEPPPKRCVEVERGAYYALYSLARKRNADVRRAVHCSADTGAG